MTVSIIDYLTKRMLTLRKLDMITLWVVDVMSLVKTGLLIKNNHWIYSDD